MQIHFHPPSLAAALHAPALFQFLVETRPASMYGQFFLVREAEEAPLHLKFQSVEGPTVSVPVEERLLWSLPLPTELRTKAAELVKTADAAISEIQPRPRGEAPASARNREAKSASRLRRFRPAA